MRVLLADKLPDRARTRLASHGFEVIAEPSLSGAALAQRLDAVDPAVLVVRSTRVEASHVDAGKGLSLVVRAGAGVNTIDLGACSAHGVFVANCPGKNADAVAELTVGLMIALDRRIADNVADLRAGRWNKKAFSGADGLRGRTFGVLGLGGIGRAVVHTVQALGMAVVAWSRSLTPDAAAELGVAFAASPEAAARRADVLSVHLALTPETRGLVGESVLSQLKPGALFLNTSRAAVVDEDALRDALDRGGVRAGLDVFAGEPSAKEGPFTHPLASHPGVYGTHHIGASTAQAQQAVGDEVCRIVETFRSTGQVPNCVNLAAQSSATHVLVVRHRDEVGVLAGVLGSLRQDGINVQGMENTIFAGGGAASARIEVAGGPSADLIARMLALDPVLNVSVVPMSGGAA